MQLTLMNWLRLKLVVEKSQEDLVTDGIQKGHMKMHARNVAFQAGAQSHEIADIVTQLSEEHIFTLDRARELLKIYREIHPPTQEKSTS